MGMGKRSAARKAARRKTWQLMGIVETQRPNPFPGGMPPFIIEKDFGAKADIQAIWIPAQDNISQDSFKAGRVIFVCDKTHEYYDGRRFKLLEDDVLFNPEKGIYVRLISDELQSEGNTTVQIQRWASEVVERSQVENDARRFDGLNLDAHLI